MTTGTKVHNGSWIVHARSNGCNLPTMDLEQATRSLAQATKDRKRVTTGTTRVHTACAQAHTAHSRVMMGRVWAHLLSISFCPSWILV